MNMTAKIIRKWKDRSRRYYLGYDDKGNIHCRDTKNEVNMVLIDAYFQRRNKWFYKFVNPKTKEIKLFERDGVRR